MKYFLSVFLYLVTLILSVPGQANTPWRAFADEIQQTLAHSEGGVSPWQTIDKGKIRLVSCQTGIQNTTGLLTGVEVLIEPEWKLQNPVFDITVNGPYTATLMPQFNLTAPADKSWTQDYTGHIFFPILLEGTPDSDIELSVSTSLTMISETDTNTNPIEQQVTLTLPLSNQESYPSNICAALKFSLKTAAVDIAKTKIISENQLLKNADVRLRLTFPKTIQYIEIQEKNNFKITPITTEINKNKYTIVFRPVQPLRPGDIIPLNIRSSAGCYMLNLMISDKPFSPDKTDISYWAIFWAGLLFFLSSPAWCFWLAPPALTRTVKNFRKKIRLLQLSILFGLSGLLILWILKIEPNIWIQQQAVLIIFFLIGLYFLIRPFPTIGLTGVLICLLPKPFWGITENASDIAKIGITLWWMICCCLPFNLWLFNTKSIFKIFKKFQSDNISAYQHIIRLPYWILCGWLGILLVGNTLFASPSDLDVENGIQKPAMIRVVNGACFQCLKEKITLFSSVNPDVVRIYQTQSHSNWAKQKRQEYQLTYPTFTVLITKDGQEIILPQNLSTQELYSILKQYI